MSSIRIILTTIALSFIACSNGTEIKTGDILFRGNTAQRLSEAINKVTQTAPKHNYTHMGVCVVKNDTVWVYHASPSNGVCKQLLPQFMVPDTNNIYHTDLYRVKKQYSKIVFQVPINADKYIGQPYDSTYIIENKGFYCSEYIYELFKEENIFQLDSMTFKNPGTNEYNSIWVDYYNHLEIDIPEGKLGCNPNKMSESENIIFIRSLQ